ncbi:GNAT superfamily N-acetyltransferase [Paenibacillus forsythiae]|uniref:GNAT superfamily N-acetyltransferase n=1 Tax=Paenibacillus forsythiae TaxID=365616 RepID=A0ABU3H7E5_9BACL|nr:GNAT family N-acetyltransferase [Paenibacillus forsythiae]MDT3426749.1 GNAT superfamily N-acetyltransferase [Paenibacillus forsythiae]
MNSSTQAPVLQIRNIGMNDLETITALLRGFGYPTTLNVMKERLEAVQNDPARCTLVAEVDGRTVGMIELRQVLSYCKEQECIAELTAIIVEESLRRSGLGKRLIAAGEEWARSRQCKQIFLSSGNRVERAPAHAFYRHLGFEQNGYRFSKSLL